MSSSFVHIAHRGGGGEAPENTLAAFRNGARHADVLELDIRVTRDAHIVICHDPEVGAARIAATDLADLPLVQGQEPVCTLEQLLDDAQCAQSPICLDFKVRADDALIRRVHDMFASRGRLGRLVWGSFREATRQKCERLFPNVPTYCSLELTAKLYIAFLFGLLPFLSLPHSCSLLATVLLRDDWLTAFVEQKHALPLRIFLKTFHRLGGIRFVSIISCWLKLPLALILFIHVCSFPGSLSILLLWRICARVE